MKMKQLIWGMKIVFLSIVLTLTACSGNGNPGSAPTPDTEGETGFSGQFPSLTHVFLGEKIPLSEDYSIAYGVDPWYTLEGRVRMCCRDRGGEDRKNYIYEVGTDGSDPTMTVFSLANTRVHLSYGAFTEEKLVCIGYTEEEGDVWNYVLYVYTLADGSCTVLEDIKELETEDNSIPVLDLETDDDGYIYLITATDCVVLNPDGTRLFGETFPSVGGIGRRDDGTVYITGNLDRTGNTVVKRVNPETKTFEKGPAIPSEVTGNVFLFGPGYDLYYTDGKGLHGIRDGTTEPVMNWQNSSISENIVYDVWVLTPEILMICHKDLDSEQLSILYSIYEKTDDINPDQIHAVKLACVMWEGEKRDIENAVNKFNAKSRNGVRVMVMDYSIYNTEENPHGGETRLLNDILNGIYTPDIVAGTVSSRLLSTLIEKRMFMDLYQFMDENGKVQKDDLFGCIRTTFEVDGALSALCREFGVNTLLAKKESVGDKTSWTLGEMLDLAESLDEEHHMMPGVTAENAVERLFGTTSYNEFVDMENMTCDFSSPLFIRMLEYMKSLEDKYYEGGWWSYEGQQTGACMLYEWHIYQDYHPLFDHVPFRTPDVVKIGYPTSRGDGSGSVLAFYSMNYMILEGAQYPEEAWAFLSDYVGANTETGASYSVLKSLFYKRMEKEEDTLYFFSFDSASSASTNKKTLKGLEYREDGTVRYRNEIGILAEFSWEKVDAFAAWLDTIGTPLGENIPLEVSDIINEEISVFLGGAKSAEDTAKIIQSRVSLWLAEHE